MVLFNEALDHLIRIHRMLRIDRGHVLLIGSSGNGKKSLSKLAAFTSGEYDTLFNHCNELCVIFNSFMGLNRNSSNSIPECNRIL